MDGEIFLYRGNPTPVSPRELLATLWGSGVSYVDYDRSHTPAPSPYNDKRKIAYEMDLRCPL